MQRPRAEMQPGVFDKQQEGQCGQIKVSERRVTRNIAGDPDLPRTW